MRRYVRLACFAVLWILSGCSFWQNEAPERSERTQALTIGVSGSSVEASRTDVYGLSSLGTADWAHYGAQGFVHKASANQISDLTMLGGSCGTNTQDSRHAAWSTGNPVANATWGGAPYDKTKVKLVAHLEGGPGIGAPRRRWSER